MSKCHPLERLKFFGYIKNDSNPCNFESDVGFFRERRPRDMSHEFEIIFFTPLNEQASKSFYNETKVNLVILEVTLASSQMSKTSS